MPDTPPSPPPDSPSGPPRGRGSAARSGAGGTSFATPSTEATTDDLGGLYRLLIDSVRDYAIFALDPEGYVLSWNPGAERFKGYRAEEIVGRHFSTFYPEEDWWKPAHELAIARKEGRYEEEGWRVRKDGSRFWANVVITALRDEAGTLVGFAKVTRDLTERREAQLREVENARRIAVSEEANRAKAGFLAAMSHELRTPLNAIAGYTDLLLMGVGGPPTGQHRDYLQRIRSSQQHLLAIINDILNFSRLEAGQLQYDRKPTSLRDVIDVVVPMIEPQALVRHILLGRRYGADTIALADRAKVEQVLLNLLSNAVKFTAPGGRVEVDCGIDGGRAFLRVRDNGVGIPAEDLHLIFQPFVQLGRSLTSGQGGTGLGLAISSDLAHGMGGTLEVESTEGKGSTFTLRLPLSEPPAG